VGIRANKEVLDVCRRAKRDMVKPESAFRDGHGSIRAIIHTGASKGCFQLRPVFCGLVSKLPYLELESAVTIDHFKIGTVGGNQAGAVRARGERDEHVEMQVAQLVRCEPLIHVNLPQYLA